MMTLQNKINKASFETEGMFESEELEKEEEAGKITSFIRKKKLFVVAFVILAALGYGAYDKFFNLSDAERAQKELAAAIKAVSKHMILPEGDEPVLATVTAAETLIKQQMFFIGAINGDQLLLFPRNLKAVIYSPSRDVIVNAGPIEQPPAQPQAANSQTSNPKFQINSNDPNTLTVEVRNGTGRAGYATTIAQQIAGNAGFSIVKVADAERKDYKNTIVFIRANDENKKPKIDAVAKTFGVTATGDLPDGEKGTEADVLIILGGQE